MPSDTCTTGQLMTVSGEKVFDGTCPKCVQFDVTYTCLTRAGYTIGIIPNRWELSVLRCSTGISVSDDFHCDLETVFHTDEHPYTNPRSPHVTRITSEAKYSASLTIRPRLRATGPSFLNTYAHIYLHTPVSFDSRSNTVLHNVADNMMSAVLNNRSALIVVR